MKKIITFFGFCLCASIINAATINVAAGSGTIKTAVQNASAGDVLVLDGEYTETSVKPTVAITIKAAEGKHAVINMSSRFEIKADFTLEGVEVNSTSSEALRLVSSNAIYNVTVKDCKISGCSSRFVRVYTTDSLYTMSPFINKLTVDNCLFRMGGASANTVRGLEATTAPKQLKSLEVKNSTFDGGAKGTGRFIYLHPGEGIEDVRTLEGSVEIDHCTFYNSGNTRPVYPANIDNSHIINCIFMNPGQVTDGISFAVYGTNSYVHNCLTFNAPVKIGTGASQENCISRNPYFVDAENGNFQLYKNSPAVGAGTDDSNLGDPRWGVSTEAHDNSSDPYIPYKQPYSMAPTTTSVKVIWQMNDETAPTDALVYYGTDPDNLNQQIQTNSGWNVADEGYVHVVTLTGLQPNTRYYFTVGASATRRFDKVSSTKTAPEPGTAYRIFTISDIHGNARNNW